MSLDGLDPGAARAALPLRQGDPDDRGDQADSCSAVAIGERATEAAGFLKALSHQGRLMILCHLAVQERSVTELEVLLGLRQAAVSQQLARLRREGMVLTRRDGKAVFYRISDRKVLRQIRLMQEIFAVAAAA
jgi:ArsR family transcriptional regulator